MLSIPQSISKQEIGAWQLLDVPHITIKLLAIYEVILFNSVLEKCDRNICWTPRQTDGQDRQTDKTDRLRVIFINSALVFYARTLLPTELLIFYIIITSPFTTNQYTQEYFYIHVA